MSSVPAGSDDVRILLLFYSPMQIGESSVISSSPAQEPRLVLELEEIRSRSIHYILTHPTHYIEGGGAWVEYSTDVATLSGCAGL